VAAAPERVRASEALPSTKIALEMLVLTACRSGEVRMARWPEFDLESAIWTIPEDRTKSGREHRVPLSSGALKVLDQAKDLGDDESLVFPGRRLRPLGDATMSLLLRRFGIPCVPHGMRSSFRDWCSETGVRREVAEAALAHVVKNKVEAAYARSDLLERRREVMEDWSEYLGRTRRIDPGGS
ncbi:MAG: site-specific integrase, partial [Chloroflexi bacterium]|nr:site-specific integrase [Chloroflexota bacterium]